MLGQGSARGCRFIGVELGDFAGVLLGDHAAAQLETRREFSGVEGPLVGDEAKAFDGFKIGQRGIDAVDERLVCSADLLVFDEMVAGIDGDAALFGPGLKGGKVGGNQSRGKLVAVADERAVGDENAGLELVFDRLRGDEFAAGMS